MTSAKDQATSSGIKPEKITKPHQLAAAILLGAFAIDSAFLAAARFIDQPPWIRGFLVVSAVALAATSILGVYFLITRHRESLLDDAHYSKGLAGKNKDLEKKVGELNSKVDQQAILATQRLALTQQYFESVASRLDLPREQVQRLGRALRESVRAGEDRVTQEVSAAFIRDTTAVLNAGSGQSLPDSKLADLVDRFASSRYELAFQAYDHLIGDDIQAIDLALQLERVASTILPNRFRISIATPPIFVLGTMGLLELVLTETIMNARDYSPHNSTIAITAVREHTAVYLRITNQLLPGTTVSEAWFQPGFRGIDSPDKYATGAGQGLPLVRRLMSLVGGEVALEGDALLCHISLRFSAPVGVN